MSIHACVRTLKVKIRYEGTLLRWHVSTALRSEIFGILKRTQHWETQLTLSRTSPTRAQSIALFFLSAWK